MNSTWDYVTLGPSTISAESTNQEDYNFTDLYFYFTGNSTGKVEITDHTWPIHSAAIITFLYIFVILFAIGGNSIVCYVVLGFQRMRTVTNYFIVNLAFSDIMMAILCIPFSFIANTMYTYWPFGPVLCPVVTYCQTVSVFLSCLTLVAIAIDRYVAIIHPLKPRLTVKQAFVVIAIIWVLATGISLPVAILSRIEKRKDHRKVVRDYCTEIWQSPQQKYNYSLSIMLLQYFVPLSIFVFTYIRIGVVIWVKKPPGEAENNRDQRMNASKRKVIMLGR
jgi:neuropeptide Y receptor